MSFKKYLNQTEDQKSVVYTFGRFNPMTKGHQELWKSIAKKARSIKGDGIIFTSFSVNQKKNPLSPGDKINYIRQVLPKGVSISNDDTLKTPYQVLEKLIKDGYTNIKFVVGADRKNDYNAMHKYTKDWGEGKVRLEIISFSNNRVGDFSGTKMREYAKQNDFESFKNDLPEGFTAKQSQEIFDKTRAGLGL